MTTETTSPVRRRLQSIGACDEALEWLADRDLSAMWQECERADWLLWLAATINIDRRLVVRAACRCAREALPIFEDRRPGDGRPRKAIETAEAWCDGRATLDEVRSAARAASRSSFAARSTYAVADAAVAAACAAAVAACADLYAVATCADDTAAYAADAIYVADPVASSRAKTLRDMAATVRGIIPFEVVRAAWEARFAD